jgi:hypothetical protein
MQKFTNAAASVTSETPIYSPPANTDATIHNLLITNSDSTNIAKVSLYITKTTGTFNLIPDEYELKAKSTLEMKPINLIFGDVLKVKSSITVDVFASILEEVRDF